MAEDQVDAVVCAYVAWYADRHPDRVTSYGDPETGVIVTPSLGQPAAATGADPVRAAVRTYAEQHADLVDRGRTTPWRCSPRSSTRPASTT